MTPFAASVETALQKLVASALEQIDGISDADLNTWKPAIGLQDINTFFALSTHLVSAGEYWILHAAGGQPTHRDRPQEFHATGDAAFLRRRFENWLTDTHAYLETLQDSDLARIFERDGADPVHQTIADCIMHAVEHTGVHVGHLQIQRQLWNAEKS